MAIVVPVARCACGHTRHWHGAGPDGPGSGPCEHNATCKCAQYAPAHEVPVEPLMLTARDRQTIVRALELAQQISAALRDTESTACSRNLAGLIEKVRP